MVFLLSLCIIIFINANFMQIDDNEKITVIDFPQMVSVSHRNAQMYVSYSDNKHDCAVYFFFKWILHLQVFLTETLSVSTSFSTRGL